MKRIWFFFKIALIVAAALFLLSLLIPAKVHVERSLVIQAIPDSVYVRIIDLKRWKEWSPWHEKDPGMQYIFADKTVGTGSNYTWNSENKQVGKGTLWITEDKPDELVRTEMNFGEGHIANASFQFQQVGEDATKLTWGMDSDMGFNPIGKVFGLFMDKMVGPDFEKGLANLKKSAEKK